MDVSGYLRFEKPFRLCRQEFQQASAISIPLKILPKGREEFFINTFFEHFK